MQLTHNFVCYTVNDKKEIKDIVKAEVKVEELVNEPEEEEDIENESSKFLSMSLSERHAQGLELKAKRDEMVDILAKDEDVDEKDFQLAQLLTNHRNGWVWYF